MHETLRCPGCTAELRWPAGNDAESVQCPRCRRVFDAQKASSTAIAATVSPRSSTAFESESVTSLAPAPRLRQSHTPPVRSYSAVFILVLAADVAILAIFGYEFMQRGGFLPGDPNFHLNDIVNGVAAQAPAVSYFILLIWCIVAGHIARSLNATGLYTPFTLILWLIFCPLAPVIAYVHLQHLWKSSDPLAIQEPEAWRAVPASWMIRALGLLGVVLAAAIGLGGAFANRRFDPWVGLFILVGMMAACILMIIIVYRIGQRQYQRYMHLYEDPP